MDRSKRKDAREFLYKTQKRCMFCQCDMQIQRPRDYDYATIEHIVPKSKGGTDDLDNFGLSCSLCNTTLKSNKNEFIGIRFEKATVLRSDDYLHIKQMIIRKQQIIICESILTKINNIDLLDLHDYIDTIPNLFMRGSLLASIQKIILSYIKNDDSILRQIKVIERYLKDLIIAALAFLDRLDKKFSNITLARFYLEGNEYKYETIKPHLI